MKKIVALLLILIMLFVTGCDVIEDSLGEIMPGIGSSDTENGGSDSKEPEVGESEDEKYEDDKNEDENPEVEEPECMHNYLAEVTASTCEDAGYTTYTCNKCGDSYQSDYVDALGHSYKTEVTKPTCNKDGYTTYTCSSCDYSYVGQGEESIGHSYNAVVTPATCNNGGYTTYTCSVCNYSYADNVVSSLGHSYKSTVTKPTCVDEGYTTYVCIRCADEYTANVVVALGHDWVDATTSAPKTCKSCGATEGEKLPSISSEILYVTYINVGQGDSIFIKVGDCDILIDAGYAEYGETVSDYLKNRGVDDIELMINTHPDADHCGGLTQVLTDHVVEEVWMSKNTNKSTAAYKNFVSAVKKEGLTAKQPDAGYVYTYKCMTMTVLYNDIGSDVNNSSIVVMIEYGSYRFLMTGDIGEEVETKLVNARVDLSCDVLKVGHHGSKYSSTDAFLAATGADYGVICVGQNDYGHPTSAALNRLSKAKIKVYRTDLNGNVVFSTNGESLTIPGGTTVSRDADASSARSTNNSEYYVSIIEIKAFRLYVRSKSDVM